MKNIKEPASGGELEADVQSKSVCQDDRKAPEAVMWASVGLAWSSGEALGLGFQSVSSGSFVNGQWKDTRF